MNLHDLTPEQLESWEEWLDERPPAVAEVARRLPPWKLYRLKSTDQLVTIYAYDEILEGEKTGQVSLKVDVSGRFNFLVFERRVFGIDPDDLEEADAPPEDELVGVVFQGEEADKFIDEVARPALLGEEEAERVRLAIAAEAERERE
jgi:hypothetical protein